MKLLIWLRYESPATSSTAATKSWSLTVKKSLATNQPRLLISYTHIPSCALRIDLFSFYVLSSQFRSCDNTLGNCFFFQIWSYPPAHIRKICEKKMKQIPLSPVPNIVRASARTELSLRASPFACGSCVNSRDSTKLADYSELNGSTLARSSTTFLTKSYDCRVSRCSTFISLLKVHLSFLCRQQSTYERPCSKHDNAGKRLEMRVSLS